MHDQSITFWNTCDESSKVRNSFDDEGWPMGKQMCIWLEWDYNYQMSIHSYCVCKWPGRLLMIESPLERMMSMPHHNSAVSRTCWVSTLGKLRNWKWKKVQKLWKQFSDNKRILSHSDFLWKWFVANSEFKFTKYNTFWRIWTLTSATFSLEKLQKVTKIQISEPLKLFKWQFSIVEILWN